jgi:lipopolysaccharide/colanic/teichoic acid biosynthesis glycosyltransferase
VTKRSLDVVLAVCLLVLAMPVLAIAAILIKLDSDGPVLFLQERMGRNFKIFRLFKLRTMTVSSDGSAYTLGADPRITRVGRWLRWFKIDELPQLWNVLRGDMSLVGPRPVIPELAREFQRSYERLLAARPGLTDPATLKYCREAEMLAVAPDPLLYFKTVVTPDKLFISQLYQERATVLTDVCVLAATACALLLPNERTRLVLPERSHAPVLAFPTPVPAVRTRPRTEKVSLETPFEYPLELPRRDRFGHLVPSPGVLQASGKTANRTGRTPLVP